MSLIQDVMMPMSQDFTKYQEGEPPGPGGLPSDVIISSDTHRAERLPPRQVRTRKWPILHWKLVPPVTKESWRLSLRGAVERPIDITWEEWLKLPRRRVFSDFHCVTRWSRLGNLWEGVAARHLMDLAGVLPAARFVLAHGYDDGFTTNLRLEHFADEDVILADLHDGEPISADHGGPVRLIVPKLYAWKSAKWLSALEFADHDRLGYWERSGYHAVGDPWTEQRFS